MIIALIKKTKQTTLNRTIITVSVTTKIKITTASVELRARRIFIQKPCIHINYIDTKTLRARSKILKKDNHQKKSPLITSKKTLNQYQDSNIDQNVKSYITILNIQVMDLLHGPSILKTSVVYTQIQNKEVDIFLE